MRGLPYVARLAFGLRRPKAKLRGTDVAGEITALGPNVTSFKVGDQVYGWCPRAPIAEYVCVSEHFIACKPTNLTFEQAAAVPLAATTALQGLRDVGKVQPGQKVLVNGASGGVGTFAVQLAKAFGAEVTGVCGPSNTDLVRSLGADHVIDYTENDFTRSGKRYDCLFDNVGNRSLSDLRRVLAPRGTLIPNAGSGGPWLGPLRPLAQAFLVSMFVRQRTRPFFTKGEPLRPGCPDRVDSGWEGHARHRPHL
jgi:NADPH:quinone reductase-like Zn-dependent oxidoreductase